MARNPEMRQAAGVPSELSANERTFRDALEIWAAPEIERRRIAGTLPADFRLTALQVLASPTGGDVVRLNDEVSVMARYKIDSSVALGQEIKLSPDRIESLALSPDDDPNVGHFTMMLIEGQWIVSFDFRYNRQRSAEHVQRAQEFLDTALLAIGNQRLSPACELLFAALELAMKAELLLVPRDEPKKHGLLKKRFDEWGRLGNAPSETPTVYAALTKLRASARYMNRPFAVSAETIGQYATTAGKQIEHVQARIKYEFSLNADKEN